jgi:hypothetical protein
MRIVEEIVDDVKVYNVYADDGKVFAERLTGKKLGTGRCNHLVVANDTEIEKYIEIEKE